MKIKALRFLSALTLMLNPRGFNEILKFLDSTKGKKHWKVSYSQDAEDLTFLSCFYRENSQNYKGTYLDIGAYHPERFSNTYLLYLLGWRGVNVEANPNLIPPFIRSRPLDRTLNFAVGKSSPISLFISEKKAMSTTNPEVASKLDHSQFGRVEEIIKVPGITINELLGTYFPSKGPDLMTIDVEGMELEVLTTAYLNKINRIKWPDWILLETSVPAYHAIREPSVKFLTRQGYEVMCVLPRSTLLRKLKLKNHA